MELNDLTATTGEGTYIGKVNCDVGVFCRIIGDTSGRQTSSTSTTIGTLSATPGGGFQIGLLML